MTTPDSQEMGLKPCPFCGGQPVRDDRSEYEHWTSSDAMQSGLGYSAGGVTRTTYAIQCDCGMRVEGNNDQLLVSRWNRRPREDAGVVDAQDAARYRWLRDAPATSQSEPIRNWLWTRPFGANMACLDAAIDAALAAALGKSE